VQTQTPDELLRSTVKQIETALRKELLDRVLVAPPKFFESLIVTILLLAVEICLDQYCQTHNIAV
jgi:restriction endonuclease Mrr